MKHVQPLVGDVFGGWSIEKDIPPIDRGRKLFGLGLPSISSFVE